MSHRAYALAELARRRGPARGLVGWLYTSNPFYVLSADLVFIGLRMSFDTSGKSFETGALLVALLGYTLLLATTACLLIRVGRIWDDARTILLLVVAMFLAISVTFDEALAGNPALGKACFLGGLVFAVLVSEGLLRGIRLRLPSLYRLPYYLILSLFFLYPVALTPCLREPESPTLRWLLFGFSPVAGLAFLTLIPAIRRGPGYLAKNGSPWPYPLYPWSLFGLLAAGVCGRASYLCISLHFVGMSSSVGRSDCIFGPYFLVPFLLALDVLLVEAAAVSRHRVMQRVAMAVLPGALVLAVIGHRPDPVFRGFLELFMGRLGGSPLFLTLLAVAGLYGYAAARRVPMATVGLRASLVALAFVGPRTVNLGGLVTGQPLPLLAFAALEIESSIRHRQSWRSVLGSVGLVAASLIELERWGIGGYRFFLAYHLTAMAAVLIGVWFRDSLARLLEGVAAAMLALSCLIAAWGGLRAFAECSPELVRAYPISVIVCAGAYGLLTGRISFSLAAGVGLAGWLASAGWRSHCDLRRVVVGLDWISSGLAFFAVAAVISLLKTCVPAKWVEHGDEAREGRIVQAE